MKTRPKNSEKQAEPSKNNEIKATMKTRPNNKEKPAEPLKKTENMENTRNQRKAS